MVERILRLTEVMGAVGLRHSAIYTRIRDGRFPAPVKITEHAVGWRESDIITWISQRSSSPVKRNAKVLRIRDRRRAAPLGTGGAR